MHNYCDTLLSSINQVPREEQVVFCPVVEKSGRFWTQRRASIQDLV